jgi:hypothetical protein
MAYSAQKGNNILCPQLTTSLYIGFLACSDAIPASASYLVSGGAPDDRYAHSTPTAAPIARRKVVAVTEAYKRSAI